jgi:predicted transposase YdaD
MARRFDATLKDLIEAYPRDWLRPLGFEEAAPVEVISADLSTVTAEADRVLRVRAPRPWLLHLELQAGRDVSLPRRLLRYNVLLHDRHALPVRSAVVLLRRQADDHSLTGTYEYAAEGEDGGTRIRYRVVRIWQHPVESILEGGLGTLPLAPLADVPRAAVPDVIRRMDERLRAEAPAPVAAKLWTATYVLMGLRYDRALAAQLLQGVRQMKESVTYQAILDEGRAEGRAKGRAEELQRVLLLQGEKRFGPAGARVRETLAALHDIERLEALSLRLLDVESWDELLPGGNGERRE